MKIIAEMLQKQWDGIDYFEKAFLRIDTEHPLEWHIGYISIEKKALLLISNYDMGNVDSSASMAVKRGYRETDNRWTLTFELLRKEQQGVFINFCCDIIEYSRSALNSKEAIKLVIKRYKQWNRLLENQRKGLMDEAVRKGLIAELIYLRKRIEDGDPALEIVQGWVGPDGGDQDFVYSDGWYEIKAVGLSATSVSISSLEQLDNADKGALIVMRIDKCAPEKKEAFSLNSLVQSIKISISSEVDASILFEHKLAQYGYIELPDYSEQKYYFSGYKEYFVDSRFPRIIRKSVPIQVVDAQYSLSILSLEDWKR